MFPPVLGVPRLKARVARLTQLSLGLIREADQCRNGRAPPHPPNRDAYLGALHRAARALEEARIALCVEIRSLEGWEDGLPVPPAKEGPPEAEHEARGATGGPPDDREW